MGEPKIVVVDYHKGNLSSVVRGLVRAGAAACTSDDPEQIRRADGLVIPGVGAFYDAIAFMRQSGEADAVLDARPVLYNLQNLVARAPENAQGLFDALREKDVVIVCEVGSGIVPLDRNERETREQTGRLVNRLAAEAERVVRMVCGLPQVLK